MRTDPKQPADDRQTGNNLSQDELYFRDLYDQAPLPYQSLDIDGKILLVNHAWCDLLGYTPEDVIGAWFGDYIIPPQRDAFRQRFQQFKEQGAVVNVEFELIHKNGSAVFVSGVGKIAYSPDGKFKQTHCILTNITDQRKAEQVLEESRQVYQALFENNHEVILLVNPHTGAIFAANQSASAYYGYSASQLKAMNISQINTLSPAEIMEKMGRAKDLNENVFSFKHRLASGEVREVEVFSGPIEVNGASLLYSIVHDITQQKAAEEEAARLNIAIQERLVALTQPVGEVSYLKFEDLFNVEDIQKIQDAFSEATGIASLITDVQGNPITRPSGFCRLCNDIIRNTAIGRQNCMKSDAILGRPNQHGATIQPCLSGGLLDAGTSITVGDHHIANWLIGQVWDATADRQLLLKYAEQIGADTEAFKSALNEVTLMPREQFEKISQMSFLIAKQLSKMAIQNVQQARVIVEREKANRKLTRINHLYRAVSTISQAAAKARTPQELYEATCHALVTEGNFQFAWVGLFEPTDSSILTAYPTASPELCQLETDPQTEDPSPIRQVFQKNRLFLINDLPSSLSRAAWKDLALQEGFQSVAGLPISTNSLGKKVGLIIYSSEVDFFHVEEIHLLEEVALTLTLTLDTLEEEQRRKAAEQALLNSEERYRRLFSSGNDAVYVYPINDDHLPGQFIEANPNFCKSLGYSQSELLQMTIWDIYAPEAVENIKELFQILLKNKEVLSESLHVTRTGVRIPVEINSTLFDLNGRLYALSVARNITERKNTEARIQKQLQRLSALHRIDSAISTKQPLPALLTVILDQVIEHLGVSAADILLYDSQANLLTYGQAQGFSKDPVSRWAPADEPATDFIVHREMNLHIPDLIQDTQFSRKEILGKGMDAYFGAPLVSKGKILGVLEVFYSKKLPTDSEWVKYFDTLAGQAAIAIEDTYMDEKLMVANRVLSQAYDETIEGWAHALDLRDQETEGHSRRVTELTIQLGKVCGLSDEELVYMRRGALLHDIGKMGIPDQILLKPGRLTENEWQIMKLHPQYAYNLLSPISFLHPSLDIPYCHHEKWDGSGYPHGLKGIEIPLAARIFAVVDVWDALLTNRPYRKGWPRSRVERYIREQAGKHFDPQIVNIFLTMMCSGPL